MSRIGKARGGRTGVEGSDGGGAATRVGGNSGGRGRAELIREGGGGGHRVAIRDVGGARRRIRKKIVNVIFVIKKILKKYKNKYYKILGGHWIPIRLKNNN